jgi:hypothetical protein
MALVRVEHNSQSAEGAGCASSRLSQRYHQTLTIEDLSIKSHVGHCPLIGGQTEVRLVFHIDDTDYTDPDDAN